MKGDEEAAHLFVNLFGCALAVIPRLVPERRGKEPLIRRDAVGEVPELGAHAVLRHHLARQFGRPLQVISGPRGNYRVIDDILVATAAKHDGDPVLQFRLREQIALLGWQLQGVSQGSDRPRNDGDAVDRISVFDRERQSRML